jgi:hypothetical protein
VAGVAPAVQQTSFNRAAGSDSNSAPQTVQFGRRAPRLGDVTDQAISMDMRLTLNMRQGNEIISKNQSAARTEQHRIMTTTAVDAGRVSEMQVKYMQAAKQITNDQDANAAKAGEGGPLPSAALPARQPVEGKTYVCRRAHGENSELIILNEAGQRPSKEELEIIAPQMEMVGRTNPLAEYLVARPIKVGETLELPKNLASQIFSLPEKFGEVTRFTLTLQTVQVEGGANCAAFLADVEAASNDASQMRLQVGGPLVVQVDTCRAVRVGLSGPIAMSETRGTYSTSYQVIGTGRLQMSLASTYRETAR